MRARNDQASRKMRNRRPVVPKTRRRARRRQSADAVLRSRGSGPLVRRRSIATSTIAERVDAGESVNDIAADYDLAQSKIEQAVVYERAA
jgi:hypothetical protein